MFSGESQNPKKVTLRIHERIMEFKEKGFSSEEFEIVRKKHYGKTVRAFTDVDTIANGLVVSHFENDNLFSEFKVLQEITADYCYELLKNSFDKEKAVLSVVNPKEI
jgi:predicted Zn-dependent peptidase